MEYSSVITKVQIQFQRRADGRAVLRASPATGPSPIRSWIWWSKPTGALAASRAATPYCSIHRLCAALPAPTAQAQIPAPEQARVRHQRLRPSPCDPALHHAAAPTENVTVKPGDTAGRIASAHRPADVAGPDAGGATAANPDAFIQGNVNRLKGGAVLQLSALLKPAPHPMARHADSGGAKPRLQRVPPQAGGFGTTAEVAASGRRHRQGANPGGRPARQQYGARQTHAVQRRRPRQEIHRGSAQRKQAKSRCPRRRAVQEHQRLKAQRGISRTRCRQSRDQRRQRTGGARHCSTWRGEPETPASAADAAMPEGTASEAAPAAAAEPVQHPVASEAAEAASEAAPAKPVVVPAPCRNRLPEARLPLRPDGRSDGSALVVVCWHCCWAMVPGA